MDPALNPTAPGASPDEKMRSARVADVLLLPVTDRRASKRWPTKGDH
jgi:hypothetical protein